MRSIVRFAPFFIGILAAVPAFANIFPTIDVQVVSTGATTEDILMWVDLHEVGGDCPLAGATPCKRTRISLTVTPAPVGLPATNGSYSITYFAEITPTRSFTLNRGQQYTFTTHTKYDVGKPAAGGTCDIKCIYEHDGVATYTATPFPPPPPTPPVWNVTYDSSDGNVVWVTIQMTGLNVDNSCSQSVLCSSHEIYGLIVPCPEDVEGYSGAWCSGPAGFSFSLVPQGTVHAALQIGHTYTISGSHTTVGLTTELGTGPCAVPACTFTEPATEKVVAATPVATRPVTWGAVKSMYRQ